jgi:hypothetical protein
MDFWRQLNILSPRDIGSTNIVVIGAGGIGSPTVLALSKMGFKNITVYDHDTIESHNLPNQFYRIVDLGKPKVLALKEIVKDYSGNNIDIVDSFYTNQTLKGIVISGVDSMEARQIIWNNIKYNTQVNFYIDARMGAEVARILTLQSCNSEHINWYESTLHSDSKSFEAPCSARSIIYCTFMIASLIGSQVKKLVKLQEYNKEIVFDLVTNYVLTK